MINDPFWACKVQINICGYNVIELLKKCRKPRNSREINNKFYQT